jgi:carboxypeptidase C (cathepsin A)
MQMRIWLFFCVIGLSVPVLADEKSDTKKPESQDSVALEIEQPKPPVVTNGSVEIAGKNVPYRATSGTIALESDDGKPRASMFFVSYERSDVKDTLSRPVMFSFNGGPGSSAVWLHIGFLGPKLVEISGDGTVAPSPPVRLRNNPHSLLDECDLVFIDPISTGYSRAEKGAKPADFHGLEEDIESVSDFIRRWVTKNKRWSSPKFLLGESYGGIRAAGLAKHLQSRFGMSLNGVVLLSSLLDFSTISSAPGNDLSYQVFLPSFAVVGAHFKKVVAADLPKFVAEVRSFAFGEYASALLKGSDLEDGTRRALADKLERFTGLAAGIWLEHDLRVAPEVFRSELLKAEGKVIGRFDGRVAWDSTDSASPYAEYDPSYSLVFGAFSTAMLDYLGRELKVEENQPYEILTGKVQPWRWNANNRVVNVADRLAVAMRDNPKLRVLIMAGYKDLATPADSIAHSVRHMPGLPKFARANISTTYYDAGHMFYLNPPDLAKGRKDLVEFLTHP